MFVKTCLCACSQLHLHVNTHENIDEPVQERACDRECVFSECVTPSSTHYSRTCPRVAFTSDLCSTAGTITERPASSADVHHIHSPLLCSQNWLRKDPYHFFFSASDPLVALIRGETEKNTGVSFDDKFNRVRLYLFINSLFFFSRILINCFYVYPFSVSHFISDAHSLHFNHRLRKSFPSPDKRLR